MTYADEYDVSDPIWAKKEPNTWDEPVIIQINDAIAALRSARIIHERKGPKDEVHCWIEIARKRQGQALTLLDARSDSSA